MDLLGGIFLVFCGVNPVSGSMVKSRQLAYVSATVPYPFLSREECSNLGLIPKDFPTLGGCLPNSTLAAAKCSNSGVAGPDDFPCSCPRSQLPLTTPPTLPCAPTVENIPVLREYILDRYSSSAFNMCEQQPLPLMQSSPPLRLFLDEHAPPQLQSTALPQFRYIGIA